jgi:hypothetical protein
MKHASGVVKWVAGCVVAAPLAISGFSAVVMAEAASIVIIVVAALCWAITDSQRARRLAMLIAACRGDERQRTGVQVQPTLPARGPCHTGPDRRGA